MQVITIQVSFRHGNTASKIAFDISAAEAVCDICSSSYPE